MAEIEQVQAEVNQACSRYKNDKMKMEQLLIDMDNYKSMAESSASRMQSYQSQMSLIESQISSLQSEINSHSGEEGYDASYAYNRMKQLYSELQSLQSQYTQEQQTYNMSITNLRRARAEYSNYEQDLENVTRYLELVRAQMIQAADVLQNKVNGFAQSIDILGDASGNMFGGSALSQISHLQTSQNEYQRNLSIAQNVIEQINGTIDDQGSAYTKALRR